MSWLDKELEAAKAGSGDGARRWKGIRLKPGDDILHPVQLVHMEEPRIVENIYEKGTYVLQTRVLFWPFATDDVREVIMHWVNISTAKDAVLVGPDGKPREVTDDVLAEIMAPTVFESSNLYKLAEATGALQSDMTINEDGSRTAKRRLVFRKMLNARLLISVRDSKDGKYSRVNAIFPADQHVPPARVWAMPDPMTSEESEASGGGGGGGGGKCPRELEAFIKGQVGTVQIAAPNGKAFVQAVNAKRAELDGDSMSIATMRQSAAIKLAVWVRAWSAANGHEIILEPAPVETPWGRAIAEAEGTLELADATQL